MIITFEEYLLEVLNVPNLSDGLKKRRHTMPQLTDFDSFVTDLKENDIAIKGPISRNPKDLTPTQSNFNEDKVRSMIEDGVWDKKPIIVSNDDYVVDGHHRWLAASEENAKVECRIVDMTANDLLEFLKGKDYVEKKTISE